MVSALICSHADLEKDLEHTLLWRKDVDRHFAARLEEARLMAVASRPHIVVVDRDAPWAAPLVSSLREEPSTRRLSIVVVARGDFEPGEVELLEAGANAVLRLPVDADGDRRLERLVDVPARKDARFSVSFQVDAYSAGAPGPERAHVCNLSRSGMLIEATVPLRVGHHLDLHFRPGEDPYLLRLRGRVVRLERPSRYGIEFIDVPADAASRISGFLDSLGQD